MTESIASTADTRGDRRRLLVVIAAAALVLMLAEWGSSRLVSDDAQAPDEASTAVRPDNATIVPNVAASLPPPKDAPSVWVLGNSHTYALPGLQPGAALRSNEQGILIDELAVRVGREYPAARANFYLLAYPNFLPFEMLTRVGHLLEKGHHPDLVFIGLTWRNIARDSLPRHSVYQTYRDKEFCAAFTRMLADPRVGAAAVVLDQVAAQQRRIEHDEEQERLQSDSDKIDEVLTNWASSQLTLMHKSADLRAYLFRAMTYRVQQMWDDRTTVAYTYDLVDHDYKFNLECLRALLRLLRGQGATVICYFAPERSDLPLLMDPQRQNEFIAAFEREAADLGVIVVDAREIVPNEYWGWVGDSPDRGHFTEPGHQRLAQFLLEQAERRSVWKELAQP